MSALQPGDRVLVPWGLDREKPGTLLSLFGPSGRQFARVELEFHDDDGLPTYQVISVPVDALERMPAA